MLRLKAKLDMRVHFHVQCVPTSHSMFRCVSKSWLQKSSNLNSFRKRFRGGAPITTIDPANEVARQISFPFSVDDKTGMLHLKVAGQTFSPFPVDVILDTSFGGG
ncbi:unnamed protein product [Cuscuta epithymum]|uniref:Uncharacterized protein n=1 Tax=Cuscuta epithymum TaxID=186058 RepID=A0AAV0DXC2_9ASTE|nr:unnamed protein product [Cuscuta epithymum]